MTLSTALTGTARIARAFARAREEKRLAIVVYLTVGYPDRAATGALLRAALDGGADLLEVVVPFGDPLADGAPVQRASEVALRQGVSLRDCIAEASAVVRERDATVLLMGYTNPFLRYRGGVAGFASDAARAGVAGIIVPDLPSEESAEFDEALDPEGLARIDMYAPTTPDARLARLLPGARGFVYCVSLTGVTGARRALGADVAEFVARVRRHTRRARLDRRAARLRARNTGARGTRALRPCAHSLEHSENAEGDPPRFPSRRARASSFLGGRSARRRAPWGALVLVVMKRDATKEEIDAVVERIKEFGITPVPLPGAERTAIGTFGSTSRAAAEAVESLPGVAEVVPISRPFKLASREVIGEDTVVKIGDVPVGHGHPLAVIAGPCAVESREVTLETARSVRAAGGAALRGGAFKPRSSPYTFRGMGGEGLAILAEARAVTGLPIVTEVLAPEDVDAVARVADCLQIGARNMQNFSLLDAVGEQTKPVLLKRGMSATVEELLLSAEYVLARGNRNVILCERGIRTFERYTRNTFDINAIPLLKRLTHLPVLADPSHGTGKWYLVTPIALAAVAAGADGLLVEVHPSPDHALSA